jgi:hypothetical protein
MSFESAPTPSASAPMVPSSTGLSPKKPSKLETVGILMLINGILNVIANVSATLILFISLLGGAISTFGLGCLCFPLLIFPVLPMIFGIFEIMYGARLMSSDGQPVRYATVQTVAVIEIVCILFGNIVSLAIGIVNLVFLGDTEVKNYYGV